MKFYPFKDSRARRTAVGSLSSQTTIFQTLIQILFKQKQRREAESIPPDHGLLSARAPTLVRPTTERSPWSGRVKEAFKEASDDEKQMLERNSICMKYFP